MLRPTFQSQVNLKMNAGFPGDIASANTAVDLFAKGYFAKDDLIVGNACFQVMNAQNQVTPVQSSAGVNAPIAGFVVKNQAFGTMGPTDSYIGYSMAIKAGQQTMIAVGTDFVALILGVDTTGVANHVPLIGEQIWVNVLDGSLAAAPISVTTVTGYVKALGWQVSNTGLINSSVSVLANQTLGIFSGYLGRG